MTSNQKVIYFKKFCLKIENNVTIFCLKMILEKLKILLFSEKPTGKKNSIFN